jgi:hypothetical protein
LTDTDPLKPKKYSKLIGVPRYASGLWIGWWRKFWDE